jgi:hypothetical protein
MLYKSILSVAFFCVLHFQSGFAQSDFQRVIRTILSKDFPKYQWRNIPVNGYGVATTYRGTKANSKKLSFLGGTYAFFGLDNIPSNADSLMRPNKIIEAPCSPELTTTIEIHKAGIFKAILPMIASLFGFSASLSDSVNRSASIDTLEICDRRIQEGAANLYIEQMKNDPLQIQKNYDNDELIMVIRDIVIKKLTVTINADSKLASSINANLLGKPQKNVGDSANLGVQLSKLTKTTFKMSITTPVVVGYLAVSKGADSRGELINSTDYLSTNWSKSWRIVSVPAYNDKKIVKKRKK